MKLCGSCGKHWVKKEKSDLCEFCSRDVELLEKMVGSQKKIKEKEYALKK